MISPSELNLLELPWLPLEERASLPSQPAIYFAIDSLGDIQYIGRSVDLRQRWQNHHRFNQLREIGSVRIAYLFVDTPELLPAIESALIEWFDPPLNMAACRLERRKSQTSAVFPGKPIKELHCQLAVLIAKKNLDLAEESQHLSQRKLAKELGVSATTVNKLYNGRPLTARIDPEVVEKVCDYFECEVGDLLVLKDEEKFSLNAP